MRICNDAICIRRNGLNRCTARYKYELYESCDKARIIIYDERVLETNHCEIDEDNTVGPR